jgi:HEAT repeat protein
MQVAREAQRKNMIMAQVKKLGNKDWASRKVAVEALASLCAEDSSVLEYVMALMDSKSDKSRQTAVWAIQRIVNKGHVEAIEMLMRRLEHPGEEVRMAALSALSNVAVKGQAAAIQSAVKRLGHQSWTTREAAVDALQHVALQGDACAIEGLAECIRIDKDWRVRQVAVEGMAGLLDASLGSVRVALQCFAAVCDGAQGAAEGPAMHLSLSCYRSMLSKCGIPSHVGECSRGCRAGDGESKFKCRACVEGVKQWAGSRLWQGMALAFAMGSHQRVGCDSWVGRLDPELIPLILAYA